MLVVVSMSMGLQAQEAKEIVIEQAAAGKAAAGIIADVQIVVAPAVAAPAAVKDDPKQAAKPKSDKATDKVIEKIPRAFDRNRPEPEEEVEAPKKNAMVNFAMDPDRWTDVIYSQLGGSE
ncbi:MAG: hypothetical protein ACKO9Q_19440, partial [Pirellula sp.]